uniref:SPIN-DOC-like zinc-finger domain-containing protein n=1 Tax=Anopheles atroparvus TaxID=41427 RepID=A0AAG5D2H1_ANOAO
MSKKRKIDLENRVFNPTWSVQYFVSEFNGKITCLLCNDVVAICKEYNIRRHYQTKHESKYSHLSETERVQKFEAMNRSVSAQRNLFVNIKSENESITKTSLRIAHLIAKHGKPFTDSELIKSCLVMAAEELCPEKKKLFETIPLSARTTVRRIEEISNDIEVQLKQKVSKFQWFSLTIDESTDVTDTAQLLIFIRGVNSEFEITEELLSMRSLHDRTTGEDIFKEVEISMKNFNLHWDKLKSVTTDGAKNMCGTGKGLIGNIFNVCKELNCPNPIAIHCIIHQQVLCAKNTNVVSVVEVVSSMVNFIRSRGLNHRQFRQFLREIQSDYTDIPYHTAVRWLSNGEVLLRFFKLRQEIAAFLKEKKYPQQEVLSNEEWLWKLAFVTDIVGYLNKFNLKLQGETKLICELYSTVKTYRQKFELFKTQVELNNFDHFTCCKSLQVSLTTPFPNNFASEILIDLNKQLQQRFADLDKNSKNLLFFQNPFNCVVNEIPSELQLEIIELKNDETLKNKFNNMDLVSFYKILPEVDYSHLKSFGRGFISIFGSTYSCEKTFSKMKYVKSQYRSSLTDDHLQSVLIAGGTKIEPRYDKIIAGQK